MNSKCKYLSAAQLDHNGQSYHGYLVVFLHFNLELGTVRSHRGHLVVSFDLCCECKVVRDLAWRDVTSPFCWYGTPRICRIYV